MTTDSHSPIRPLLPVLGLLYAATFWGMVWYPLRQLEQMGMGGTWQTLVSYGCAALVILPFLWSTRAWRSRPAPGWLLLLAITAGWANVAFVLAVLEGNVVRVLLFFYLSPVWATLLGWLILGERPERVVLLTVPLGLAGAAAMLWQPDVGLAAPLARADWLALSAGMTFALSNVAARHMGQASVRLRTFASWVGVVVISLAIIGLLDLTLPEAPAQAWGGAALLGAVGFFTVTLGAIYGVSHMPVQRSAVIMLFEIVAGGLSAWWLVGEAMGLREWIGGGLIVGAGLLAATRDTG